MILVLMLALRMKVKVIIALQKFTGRLTEKAIILQKIVLRCQEVKLF